MVVQLGAQEEEEEEEGCDRCNEGKKQGWRQGVSGGQFILSS